jgi:hypothetical protein
LQRKKEESDRLYTLYQQEKQKQREQDAQANSQAHLRQTVDNPFSILLILVRLLFFSKNEKIVNVI